MWCVVGGADCFVCNFRYDTSDLAAAGHPQPDGDEGPAAPAVEARRLVSPPAEDSRAARPDSDPDRSTT